MAALTTPLIPLVFLIFGCGYDPYDPPVGPRNPRPGAERYLSTRKDIPQSEKEALLNFRPCSLNVLKELSNAPSREVRSFVVANPGTDGALLAKFLNDKEPGVRQYLGLNPKTPRAILLKLSGDPDAHVRWVLPRNPNWTSDDIREMYKDKESWSRLASNGSAPQDILEKLSEVDDSNIKIGLANNPSIPDSVVRKLSQEGDTSVKMMLTYNEATSEEVLRSLAKDADGDVRRYADIHLKRRFETK